MPGMTAGDWLVSVGLDTAKAVRPKATTLNDVRRKQGRQTVPGSRTHLQRGLGGIKQVRPDQLAPPQGWPGHHRAAGGAQIYRVCRPEMLAAACGLECGCAACLPCLPCLRGRKADIDPAWRRRRAVSAKLSGLLRCRCTGRAACASSASRHAGPGNPGGVWWRQMASPGSRHHQVGQLLADRQGLMVAPPVHLCREPGSKGAVCLHTWQTWLCQALLPASQVDPGHNAAWNPRGEPWLMSTVCVWTSAGAATGKAAGGRMVLPRYGKRAFLYCTPHAVAGLRRHTVRFRLIWLLAVVALVQYLWLLSCPAHAHRPA